MQTMILVASIYNFLECAEIIVPSATFLTCNLDPVLYLDLLCSDMRLGCIWISGCSSLLLALGEWDEYIVSHIIV